MSIYFPTKLKPITSLGYSFGASTNIFEIPVEGGNPLIVKKYKHAPINFQVSLIGNRLVKSVFTDFFYGKIDSGTKKFFMNLDSGYGLEEHICQIVPQTLLMDGGRDPTWVISFTVRAEKTPAQDDPYEGTLVDMYAAYGDDIETIFNSLEDYVLNFLPTISEDE